MTENSLRIRKGIGNEMKHKFGNDLRVDFELVDDIPREKVENTS